MQLGQFDEAVWAQTIGLLRKRAGVNAAFPQTADPYLREVYFPEIADRYLLEIRGERGIELRYENLRYQDLMRWKKSGHVIWGANEERSFEDKKYLYPISNSDIVRNPNLVQNPDR